jgi:hypothetical protein
MFSSVVVERSIPDSALSATRRLVERILLALRLVAAARTFLGAPRLRAIGTFLLAHASLVVDVGVRHLLAVRHAVLREPGEMNDSRNMHAIGGA